MLEKDIENLIAAHPKEFFAKGRVQVGSPAAYYQEAQAGHPI